MRGKMERVEEGKEGRKEKKSSWADSSAATLFYIQAQISPH